MIKSIKKVLKSNKFVYSNLVSLNEYIFKQKQYLLSKNKVKQAIKEGKVNKNGKNIYFLLCQNHGNMGDQAIGLAEYLLIRDNLSNSNIINIMEDDYKLCKNYIKKVVKKNDIIGLQGGGSIGNQYLSHEQSRRHIIRSFPNNKIISFPQTIYFSNDDKGQVELNKTIESYSKHKDLTVIAREVPSYELMKTIFKNNNVFLTPDIVMYLNKSNPKIKRQGALCCFRNDCEGVINIKDKELIKSKLNDIFDSVKITDMEVHKIINFDTREMELEKKFNEFKAAELVITDRLHGMIFAAITSTPCIVLSNYNHKVKGTYEWLKDQGYIKYAENVYECMEFTEELRNINDNKIEYNKDFSIQYYNKIINVINA